MEQFFLIFGGIVVGSISLVLFLSPAIYAYKTKHPHWILITLLVVCTGWLIWPWILAIFWAAIGKYLKN